MLATDYGLADAFLRAGRANPTRPALVLRDRTVSYEELCALTSSWAATIDGAVSENEPLVAVLGERSLVAYAGILAALISGRGYLPLHPRIPADRMTRIMELSDCRVILIGQEAVSVAEPVLSGLDTPLVILLPDTEPAQVERLRAVWFRHEVVGPSGFRGVTPPERVLVEPHALAYLLFTSGSTGEPKGVGVSHANVAAYTRYITEHYQVTEQDRFSQLPDLTFDLSIQDLWPCWTRGACLCSVPKKSTFSPAAFVREQGITMWTSVPSVVSFMDQLHLLKPGVFPTIRWSVFCGEALSLTQAQAWTSAASESRIENLYGPTEVTCASTGYLWDPESSPAECRNGIVPIGRSFPHQKAVIVNEEGREVEPGLIGELCLGGPQVAPGYFNDPVRTAESFVHLPGSAETWYRTGDLCSIDQRGCLHYAGRKDNQVKIRGYRVELQEIDFAVRRASGLDAVVSIAWPIRDGSAEGVVTFVGGPSPVPADVIIAECRQALPDYMVPKQVLFVPSLPVTANGKVDRKQLSQLLQKEIR